MNETESGSKKKKPRDAYHGSNEVFRRVAAKTAHGVGHPLTFIAALGTVVLWGASGRFFHYSDTWQLVINTGTTIVTFLMVFLIQNTQNRDSHALHLKLDELIHANRHARNHMMALEELSEHELDELQHEFDRIACEKVQEVKQRRSERRPNVGPHTHENERTSSSRIAASVRTTKRAASDAE